MPVFTVTDDEVFTEEDFEVFPVAIQKYIDYNGYIGKKKMNFVRMEYNDVDFSQGKTGPNLSIDYTQYDYVSKQSRLAMLESSMFGIPFQGYDYYSDSKGGINQPTNFKAIWNYQDGDFVYFDGTISSITYD